MIIRAVDHKADCRLDRTAGKNAQAAGDPAVLFPDGVEEARPGTLTQGAIEHDPERSARAVAHHQDNRVIEARVKQSRRGDQDLAGEGSLAWRLRGILQGPMDERRRQQDRRESQKRTLEPSQWHDFTVDRSGRHNRKSNPVHNRSLAWTVAAVIAAGKDTASQRLRDRASRQRASGARNAAHAAIPKGP